jgi:hypothetical protein
MRSMGSNKRPKSCIKVAKRAAWLDNKRALIAASGRSLFVRRPGCSAKLSPTQSPRTGCGGGPWTCIVSAYQGCEARGYAFGRLGFSLAKRKGRVSRLKKCL